MALRKNAKIELLKGVPLFSACSRKELEQLARAADEIEGILFGDPVEWMTVRGLDDVAGAQTRGLRRRAGHRGHDSQEPVGRFDPDADTLVLA